MKIVCVLISSLNNIEKWNIWKDKNIKHVQFKDNVNKDYKGIKT